MKKLLILTLMFFTAFTYNATAKVDAFTGDFSASWYQATGDRAVLILNFKAPIGARTFTVNIPESEYHEQINGGGYQAEIEFRDGNGTLIFDSYMATRFGAAIGGYDLEIDIKALQARETSTPFTGDTDYITIKIPQDFCYTTCIPVDYTTYIEDNIEWSYSYAPFLDIDPYFTRFANTSYTVIQAIVPTPLNTEFITFDMSGIDYYLEAGAGYSSGISFYDDEALTTLYSYEHFSDHVGTDQDVFTVEIDYDGAFNMNDSGYFVIKLYVDSNNNAAINSQIGRQMEIYYNDLEVIDLDFYVNGVVDRSAYVFSGRALALALYNPTPPDGYTFWYWQYEDGTQVSASTLADPERAIDGKLSIIAVFYFSDYVDNILGGGNPDPDSTRSVNKILATFGMDTTLGHMLFFIVCIIAMTWLVVSKLKAPAFVAIIADTLILILFTYWGLVPTYVTVSVSIFLIVGALMTLQGRGGVESE